MSETGLCTTPRATSAAAAAATSTTTTTRSVQAWRAVVSVVGIVFGLLLQILRGTPSLAQLLSFVGLRHPLLSSAAAPAPVYKRLAAVETPTEATEVRLPAPPVFPAETVDRLTIVLDLDETLICAYETSSLPSNVRKQAMEAGLKCFDLECLSAEKDIDGKQRVNYVTVFERPGLREFLKQSSEFADLVLFTAGLEDYARPVVDKIDVDNKLDHRLYRPATVSTQYREHVKDLSFLSKDLRRIVIVDNNPFSFVLQPLNGIPCVPFSAGQPCDDQLIGVILPLLKHLSLQKDVRPVLHEKFHMPEWFEQHGIPSTDDTS